MDQTDRKKLFKTQAYLVIFIFLVNFIAVKLHWYDYVWCFDMLMHFLGGLWVGLALVWLFSGKGLRFSLGMMLKIVLGVLIVGIGWELFELYFINYIAQNPFDALDAASDIFFDLLGGLCAMLYLWRNKLK